MSVIGGCPRDLGVLLSLSCVLAALRVVVLSVMICGSTMRFGRRSRGARLLLCVIRWASESGRGISGPSLAASIVFAVSSFVVFNELSNK